MAASASGDIRTVLTLEDFEYIHGLRDAAVQTEKFAAKANAAGKQMGIQGGGFGMGMTQAAFAAQDFASILSMGGKNALGRALMSTMNNVQMLGAMFGPWGMAITAAGGAIGAMLIPKLMEGKSAFDSIAESTSTATGRLDDFIKRQGEMIAFNAKLPGLTPAGVAGAAADVALTKEQLQAAAKVKNEELIANEKRIRELKQSRTAGIGTFENIATLGGMNPLANLGLGLLPKSLKESAGGLLTGTGGAIDELTKDSEKLRKELAALGAAMGTATEKEDALGSVRESAIDDAARLAAEEEDFLGGDKFGRDMEKKAQAFRSTFDVASEKLKEIGELAKSGFLSPEDAKAASDRVIEGFAGDKGTTSGPGRFAAGAAEKGSREAYQAIANAMKQDSEPNKKLVKLNEEANRLRTEQGIILREIRTALNTETVKI